MRILILGTGNMAHGIATRLLVGGHAVTFYNPDRADAEQLAARLRGEVRGDAVVATAAQPAAAAPDHDVVILASWYAVNRQLAQELGPALTGTVVVDISNPLNATYDGLVTAPDTSAAETIRAALPAGVALVKAFNTTFAGTLVAGQVAGQPLDVLIAGDDQTAKDRVATLARDGGLTPVDVGALERSRQLEAMGLLGITLQGHLGTNFGTAWKLVLPPQG